MPSMGGAAFTTYTLVGYKSTNIGKIIILELLENVHDNT
jgi:hypothetical protein